MFLKRKVIYVLLTLTIFTILTFAGQVKYTNNGSTNRISFISSIKSSSLAPNSRSGFNKYPRTAKQQHSDHKPNYYRGLKLIISLNPSPPCVIKKAGLPLPSNPAYKYGVVPVNPNQQRPYQQKEGHVGQPAVSVVNGHKNHSKLIVIGTAAVAGSSLTPSRYYTSHGAKTIPLLLAPGTNNLSHNTFQQSQHQLICSDINVQSPEKIPIDTDQSAANQEPPQYQISSCINQAPEDKSQNFNQPPSHYPLNPQNGYFPKKDGQQTNKILNQPASPNERVLLGAKQKTDKRVPRVAQGPLIPMRFIGIGMLIVAALVAHYAAF